jgi:1-aminocyclopropane-1-carboxylate deaminase/D-cysteine desulfhydrase-like pyridoxal-dependent ACC family enzyme
VSHERALAFLRALPAEPLLSGPTPVLDMARLGAALGGGPRLLVKRDDAIPFGFGGNKVRKLALVAAQARAEGARTLVTMGGVQSNHCRATAATAARLGFACHLVLNGERPEIPRANALLDALFGASAEYVPTRDERAPAVARAVARLAAEGQRPFAIPLGASTPLGALAYALAIDELVAQGVVPSVIVHATSSAGTQAGLLAGVTLLGLRTRILGVSADASSAELSPIVLDLARAALEATGVSGDALGADAVVVEEGFVGDGYGIPSAASREAAQLAARHEALLVDHTYTAKALAAVVAGVREGRFGGEGPVLFWHTGGQVGLFA